MSKIIGIVGSRRRSSYQDFKLVNDKFFDLYEDGDWICSGGCPTGGDEFAIRIHKLCSIPYLEFPANWGKYGKSAGYKRNTDIARFSDILIACVSEDRKGGTEHTISEFIKIHGDNKLYLV